MITIKLFMDGNMVCAMYEGIENLAEDPAGFGAVAKEAIEDLLKHTDGSFLDGRVVK